MQPLTKEQIEELIAKHNIDLNQPMKECLLGDFQLGDKVRITDPCYDMETWCAGSAENVAPGTWTAYVGMRPDPTDLRGSLMWIEHSHEFILADMREELAKLGKAPEGPSREEILNRKIQQIKEHPGRVHWLLAVLKDQEHQITNDPAGSRDLIEAIKSEGFALDIDVGVDSGQAGIFDLGYYQSIDKLGKSARDKAFYGKCCNLTCDTPNSAGVIEQGVVSSSGYGDGSYTAYALRNGDEQIIAIAIEFIGLDEEDEENTDEEQGE